MPPTISFFVPCLNEEGNVGCAIDRLVEAMRETPHTYEILVVDDASTDASVAEVLARTGLEPCWLELEITESMLMGDVEAILARYCCSKGA